MEGFSTFSLSYPQSKEEKPRAVPTYLGFPQLFTCGKLVEKVGGKLSLWKTANFEPLSTDNYLQKEKIPSNKKRYVNQIVENPSTRVWKRNSGLFLLFGLPSFVCRC